ncbi:MAG: BlaI/MecI/CopY family transcriptional regulator [Candidatus ainarchaeum sp.]|nr:BlaI/MecI/CopY family transcriptional regulator [Candidatus ainarchaeum sp.]
MDNKEYKPVDSTLAHEIQNDLQTNMAKFKDPIVLGELVYRLLEERENTNRLLKNILAKLDALEAKGMPVAPAAAPILPEVDEQIMAFVHEKGRCTAEDIRAKFNYKGKNAACARLNRLCDMGLLQKQQAGKKVYFFPE